MMIKKNGNSSFFNQTKGALSLNAVVEEVASFMGDNPSAKYRLVIGSDSQPKKINGVAEIDFVTAVIIHRIGYGARYFWKKDRQTKRYVLRDKIYTETAMSLILAQELVPKLRRKVTAGVFDLEIHVDVGPIGPTREMIKEVVGMVTGSGYTAKTKPYSYGASVVADKHT